MTLDRIQKLFEQAFRDAAVFQRDVEGRSLIEFGIRRRSGADWLVIAAGVTEAEAQEAFEKSGKRAERATVPLRIMSGGEASVYLECRIPIQTSNNRFVVDFAPGMDIPVIELASSYVRLSSLENEKGITTLRWELDVRAGDSDPVEKSLATWRKILGANPAHPSSHLHINSLTLDEMDGDLGESSALGELRLAVGIPNPLALVLSLGTWLARL
jgi:hypothetical protein